jgi:hypothetical protein
MIAVYAMGGGLGHLSRARRVLQALGCAPADAAILSASPLARGPGIVPVPRHLARSGAEFGAWLKKKLRALAPSAVVVDAFPLGILGELADARVLPEVPLYHVARLLKWNAYRAACAAQMRGTPRRYDASFAVETLAPAHAAFLASHSGSFRSMDLPFHPHAVRENPLAQLPRPVWLVVHSGPDDEVRALLEFASMTAGNEHAAPQYVVVTPRVLELPAGVTRIAHPRAWELFAAADRIVTACGFNSMLEAAPWRGKHLFLPLERRFDDQHLRAARAARRRC